MRPIQNAWNDYREAVGQFSPPARHFLLSVFLAWSGAGVFQVLYNLYLLEAGFREALIGRALSLTGIGLAAAALPAGWLADRWGRRRCLVLGAVLDGVGMLVRANVPLPGVIYASSFVAGAGQSLLAIAAAPYLTEHSTPRERTHLFSAFFASELIAGVIGSLLGGWVPAGLRLLPLASPVTKRVAYQVTLSLAALIALAASIPLLRLGRIQEARIAHHRETAWPPGVTRRLWPIVLNATLIGVGAGLVIPFMNLYFATRFQCSSAQIGMFFSIAQVCTAAAALLGPVVARRFGKLRTATASELLSLPFLVTLGAERRLSIAVVSFWCRSSLMQAATPLVQAFVMEALPPALRSRSTSLINLAWNLGWAASTTLAGVVIQHLGYAVPFYITAGLYATAATTFFLAFRGMPEGEAMPQLSEEAKGRLGSGPTAD
jgi:MFS family permease